MPVLFPDHTGNERKRWRPAKEMKKTSRAILLEIVRSFVFVHENSLCAERNARHRIKIGSDGMIQAAQNAYTLPYAVHLCAHVFRTQNHIGFKSTFKAKRLKEIFESLTDDEKNILTDACKMYVLKGEHVHVLKGEVFNIKITYPFDMKVAQSLIGATEDLEG